MEQHNGSEATNPSKTTSPSDLEQEIRDNFEELLPALVEVNTRFDSSESFIEMAKLLDSLAMALFPRGQMVNTACAMKLAADIRLQHVYEIAKDRATKEHLSEAVQTMLLGLTDVGGHG